MVSRMQARNIVCRGPRLRIVLLLFILVWIEIAAWGQSIEWIRQFGTPAADAVGGIAVTDSAIHVVGRTSGSLPGQTNAGGQDAILRKYSKDGILSWTRQFGTSQADFASAVAVDQHGILVIGLTEGSFPGYSNPGPINFDCATAGCSDAFVRRYDTEGNVLWTRQFGDRGNDAITAVAVQQDGFYVVGYTEGTLIGQSSSSPWWKCAGE